MKRVLPLIRGESVQDVTSAGCADVRAAAALRTERMRARARRGARGPGHRRSARIAGGPVAHLDEPPRRDHGAVSGRAVLRDPRQVVVGREAGFGACPDVSWNTPAGGFFVRVTVPFSRIRAVLPPWVRGLCKAEDRRRELRVRRDRDTGRRSSLVTTSSSEQALWPWRLDSERRRRRGPGRRGRGIRRRERFRGIDPAADRGGAVTPDRRQGGRPAARRGPRPRPLLPRRTHVGRGAPDAHGPRARIDHLGRLVAGPPRTGPRATSCRPGLRGARCPATWPGRNRTVYWR